VEKMKKRHKLYSSMRDLNLTVVLNKDFEKLINYSLEFFGMNKPENLEIVSFTMKYVLKGQDVAKVIEKIQNSKDKVKKYELNFGGFHEKKFIPKLDSKYFHKINSFCFVISKAKPLQKLRGRTNVLKQISLFVFSYTQLIVLDNYK
jgi:hypothetical protein